MTTTTTFRCRQCGRTLHHELQDVWERRETADGFYTDRTGVRERIYDLPGYRGNGKFCTLRCGYAWAVRYA